MLEEQVTDGIIQGGVSLSTILALRKVRFQSPMQNWEGFRGSVQMMQTLDTINSAQFKNPDGMNVLQIVDLRAFVNVLVERFDIEPYSDFPAK